MENPFDLNDPQAMRENIVLRAIHLDRSDLKQLEAFDAMVCGALGLDAEDVPPQFIFDSLSVA